MDKYLAKNVYEKRTNGFNQLYIASPIALEEELVAVEWWIMAHFRASQEASDGEAQVGHFGLFGPYPPLGLTPRKLLQTSQLLHHHLYTG